MCGGSLGDGRGLGEPMNKTCRQGATVPRCTNMCRARAPWRRLMFGGLRSIMWFRDVSFAPTQRVQHKPARARKPARTSTQHGYCITAAINNVTIDNVARARATRTTRQQEARKRKARADRTAGVGKGLHGGGKGTGAGGGGMVERAHDEEGAKQAWWGTQNIGRGLNNGKARRLDEEKEARRRGGTHRGWEVEIQGSWPSDRAARVCAPFALREKT